MSKTVLNATRRTVTGKKVGVLRREGKLPGIMYGHNFEATPITLDLHETALTMRGVSGSSIITINLDGKEYSTIIREKQKNFIKGELTHVDFQVVSAKEKIRTEVGIELVGEAPAVKDFNGIVVNGLSHIEVESFPQDLPERVTLDLSALKEIGDGIFVRDIKLADTVEILTDADEMLVLVTASTAGEAEDALEAEEAASSEPEVIERGKKEEDEED